MTQLHLVIMIAWVIARAAPTVCLAIQQQLMLCRIVCWQFQRWHNSFGYGSRDGCWLSCAVFCLRWLLWLQIEFPTGDLGGFSCAEAEVRFSYKYKNLRTALSNIPQKDNTGVNSKVCLRLCICSSVSVLAPRQSVSWCHSYGLHIQGA